MSGITLGFTGSYIFSQTIFTYRSGIHDRIVGVMIMIVYAYIVASPVNILEVAPLFFLGSTLIFIGYDLMFEWLWEVRHQVFLSEYGIVWFTFISIHAVGIDFGILIGILIAICDQIFTTAQSTGVNRIEKRSRAVYTKGDAKIIHDKAYCSDSPKIVTLEVIGNLFFGSSLSMLNQIYEEVGLTLDNKQDSRADATLDESNLIRSPPRFVVLDLMGVTHLDASATRGCFLQLVKMAAKNQIIVCVSGLSPKIEWMFRSHEVAFETTKEEEYEKNELLETMKLSSDDQELERILIFNTAAEALEFCETLFLHDINGIPSFRFSSPSRSGIREDSLQNKFKEVNISTILSNFLRATTVKQADGFDRLMDLRYHKEVTYKEGQVIFTKRRNSDSFYIVLNGCVANSTSSTFQAARKQQSVVSGAGKVDQIERQGSASLDNIATLWQVGGVFGFNDFLLERKRMFETIASVDGTKLAIFTRSGMNTMSTQDPELYGLMQQVLLRASTLDLANCTCHDV
jgi:anti-anti-sigma regulatory factor/CRP-like cAMP-binding protein